MTKGGQQGAVGRPRGAKDPNFAGRIRKRLAKIYDAQIRAAENGSTEAARLCLEILQHPDRFPDDATKPKK